MADRRRCCCGGTPCSACDSGTTPSQFSAVLSGVIDAGTGCAAGKCTAHNGTYILAQTSPCVFQYLNPSPGACDIVSITLQLATTPDQITVNHRDRFNVAQNDFFTKDSPQSDCSAWSGDTFSLSLGSSSDCDYSSASLAVTSA